MNDADINVSLLKLVERVFREVLGLSRSSTADGAVYPRFRVFYGDLFSQNVMFNLCQNRTNSGRSIASSRKINFIIYIICYIYYYYERA